MEKAASLNFPVISIDCSRVKRLEDGLGSSDGTLRGACVFVRFCVLVAVWRSHRQEHVFVAGFMRALDRLLPAADKNLNDRNYVVLGHGKCGKVSNIAATFSCRFFFFLLCLTISILLCRVWFTVCVRLANPRSQLWTFSMALSKYVNLICCVAPFSFAHFVWLIINVTLCNLRRP